MRFERVKQLFKDDFKKIQEARVLILGVGGVGGYALDCLYRTGVKNITIVDFDRFDETNQNRQIGADSGIGEIKVEKLAKIYKGVEPIEAKIDREWVENFDFSRFDVIIDAVDSIEAKVALAQKNYKKLIMALGAGKRFDSSRVEVSTIFKTDTDPFARKVRSELRKTNFKKNFTVIFSREEPKSRELSSFVGVTGTFGLFCCSEAIKVILKRGDNGD